ncbi:Sau3AI family type II restriction endonuclease [Clostridium perfringens]|uniref:Sau3AI family type II restriction endonuclease n=1 Tax=Clostridium perfringens TaxID=1502 RepID=UPI0030D17B19
MKFTTEQELLDYTKNIIGKTFKELDKLNLLQKGQADKGILGKIVETGFYNYPLNSNPEADFSELGIELKVTGFIRNKNKTIRAKERISLSMIDYNNIIHEEYEFSKLISKNKKLLIIWYEYTKENQNNKGEFVIHYYQLYDMSIDELVFKNDFNLIKSKVIAGLAHELSEGDTSYLGAATKGNGQTKPQPNSDILAPTRAFSLKQSYITGILRNLNLNPLPLKAKTVEDFIYDKIKSYIGMTQIKIWDTLGEKKYSLDNLPKQINKMISDRLIGKDKELPKLDDIFSKTSYIIKNISFEENGYPKERVSFRNLTLSEFEEPWENSDLKEYFEQVTIIFICYEGTKGDKNGQRKLKTVKKLAFTSDDLDNFKLSYDAIRKTIKTKDISNLPVPGSFEKQYLELAPKGNAGDDAYNNFFLKDTTKTCFMLEKDFVFNKLN